MGDGSRLVAWRRIASIIGLRRAAAVLYIPIRRFSGRSWFDVRCANLRIVNEAIAALRLEATAIDPG